MIISKIKELVLQGDLKKKNLISIFKLRAFQKCP